MTEGMPHHGLAGLGLLKEPVCPLTALSRAWNWAKVWLAESTLGSICGLGAWGWGQG